MKDPIWEPTNVHLNKMKTSFSFILLLISFLTINGQSNQDEYFVVFYNVENLFDVKNDSLTKDDEFTFDGERHWTYKRLEQKLLNTSKAILSSSGWNAPTIIALCEVENRFVLEKLRNETPLKSIPYKIIHKESPDFRGIDVALLYDSKEFYPLKYKYYPLIDKHGIALKSREILHVSGIVGQIDTVHIFVNHWPSRYSGVMETRDLRNAAAQQLRKKVSEVLNSNLSAKIIILGDFNDQPNDESLTKYLKTTRVSNKPNSSTLYNLSLEWGKRYNGTLKYQSQWFVFDQVIVSGALLNARQGLFTKTDWASVCCLPFLLEDDKTHGGKKPARTYSGFKYRGGFSDHLPIVFKLGVN